MRRGDNHRHCFDSRRDSRPRLQQSYDFSFINFISRLVTRLVYTPHSSQSIRDATDRKETRYVVDQTVKGDEDNKARSFRTQMFI